MSLGTAVDRSRARQATLWSAGALALLAWALSSCDGARSRRDRTSELTDSTLITYPEEPGLPHGAIARLGNRTLQLDGRVRAMTLDPVERFLIASDGGRLEIFEPSTGQRERAILPQSRSAESSNMKTLSFARDGAHLIGLTTDPSRGVMVWSMPGRELLYSLPLSQVVGGLIATAADPPRIASLSLQGELVVRDLRDASVRFAFPIAESVEALERYGAIYYGAEAKTLLLLRQDGWELRDASDGSLLHRVTNDASYLGAALYPDGSRAAMVRRADNQVEIWDLGRGELEERVAFTTSVERLSRIEVDPSSGTILLQTRGIAPTLIGLKLGQGEVFRASSDDFAVSREGLIALSRGRSIRRYRVDESGQLKLIERVAGHASAPTQLKWDEGGAVLWSASPEGTIVRWEVAERSGAFFEAGALPGPISIAIDPYGDGIAIAAMVRGEKGPQRTLRWLNRRSGEEVWSTPLMEPLTDLSISAGGEVRALTLSGEVFEFNAYGSPRRRWPLGGDRSTMAGTDEALQRLAIYEPTLRKARFWDLDKGVLLGERRFSGEVVCAWYGAFNAACARARGVGSLSLGSLWHSGEVVSAFSHGFERTRGLSFSPLGRRLAVWGKRPSRKRSEDQVWLFDTALSEEGDMLDPIVLEPHDGQIERAVFHPDGRHFVTAHDNGLLYLWDLSSARSLERR